MNTLLQLIKMFKFKNLLLCGVLLGAGSAMAQFEPPGGGGGGGPTMKTLVAGTDTLNVTNPAGGTVNVLTNDTADAVTITAADLLPSADPLALALTNDAGLTANVSLDGTNGNLTVTGSPAAGSYTLNYQVCQPLFPGNCATGTINLTVTAAPAATLVATADTGSAVAGTGGTVNILANDTSNGLAATTANVTPSIVTPVTGFSINGSGQLAVATTVTAGSYPVTYKICEVGNLSNCSSTVTVTVTVTAAAATLVATADTGSAVAGVGGTVSILVNDTSNGSAATTVNVTPSIVTPVTGFSINGSGQLAVATTVTAGSYPVTYKICEVGNLSNCSSTVTVTVTVTAAAVVNGAGLVLAADAITMPVTGGSLNVLTNDRYNSAAITPSMFILTLTDNAGATGATLSPTGDLFIPTLLAQRVYLMTYKVCLVSAPTTCATSTASIGISAAVTTATVKAPSVPGATASNSNVITTTTVTGGTPLSFSTGSSSGGSTTAGSGSINDPLTFTGARVSFGESINGFATVSLYASQDIPKSVVRLHFNGAGTLNAEWVVIRPGDQEPNEFDLLPLGSLSAQQKLQRNRNYPVIERVTGYASGGSYVVAGPDPSKLPKSIPGTYRILLRLEGFGSFAMPALRYIVQSGTPPVPRAATAGTSTPLATTPQVTAASINTTAPAAGVRFERNQIKDSIAVNLAWNWGASQSATPVVSWHYEIYVNSERNPRLIGSSLKPETRKFLIPLSLTTSDSANTNLKWVVYGRDKDKQIVARSADMFFSVAYLGPAF